MKKFIFILVMLLGVALRLIGLGRAQFWYDEAFTGLVIRLPLAQAAQAIAGDTHPPLYYALVALVGLVNSQPWAIRLFSALLSIAALPLLWAVLGRMQLTRARPWAMGILALSPVMVHFAQEARMYALFTFLVLGAVWAVLARRWVLASVLCTLVLYSHNYGLFYLPFILLAALPGELARPVNLPPAGLPGPFPGDPQYSRPGDVCRLGRLALVGIIPLILFIPWGLVLAGQMGNVAGKYWIAPITPGAVLYTLYMLFWGFSMPDAWDALAVMLAFGLLAWAILRAIQYRPHNSIALFGLAFGPLALAVLASLIWQPILLFRGLLPSAPFIYALIGWAISRIRPLFRLYAVGLILPVLLICLYQYETHLAMDKGDTQGMINTIAQQWQPGDILYNVNDGTYILANYYAPSSWPQYKAPDCDQPVLGDISKKTREGLGIIEANLSDIDFKRAWILWSEGPTSPECEHDLGSKLTQDVITVEIVRDEELIKTAVYLYSR